VLILVVLLPIIRLVMVLYHEGKLFQSAE